MFKHVLIATDGSELADKAVDQGLGLAAKLGAKVTLLTVTLPWVSTASGEWPLVFPIEDYERAAAATAQRILGAAAARAKAAKVACDTVHVKDQYAAEGIVEEAKNRNCDLIVMASHGRRGVARLILGSEATRVSTHSPVPVLICR
jgi:nucleotide-binding universal stress UspA family protein